MKEETLFDTYAAIRAQIEDLQKKEESIKMKIASEMQSSGLKTFDHASGKFIMSSRKSWKFSEAVEKAEDDVKILKDQEKEKGVAKVDSETFYLTYKAK